jgi:hypothetical protein
MPRGTTTSADTLRLSEKFLKWKPETSRGKTDDALRTYIMAERHYSPDELASLWGVSADTVRNIFREEPGVLRFNQPKQRRHKYVMMRIPESVAKRVHKRLSRRKVSRPVGR